MTLELYDIFLQEVHPSNETNDLFYIYTYEKMVKTNQIRNIHFRIKEHPYVLKIYQDEYGWKPALIIHKDTSKKCTICHDDVAQNLYCYGLKKELQTIYEQLLNHQTVRFKLLFS